MFSINLIYLNSVTLCFDNMSVDTTNFTYNFIYCIVIADLKESFMLMGIGTVILGGMLAYWLFTKIKLPGIVGLLFAGILLGPGVLDVIDSDLLSISPDLRNIALIIILTRAGLSLNTNDLKKIGRPAVLMSFVPATFEIVGVVLIAPLLFTLSIKEALIMGAVVAAVSPAVIVPSMIKIMEQGFASKRKIPQLILACASVDDIFVVVLFTIFIENTELHASSLIELPLSVFTGIVIGVILGLLLCLLFKRFHLRDSHKVLTILASGFVLVSLEPIVANIPFSALIAIMTLGITIKHRLENVASRLSTKFSKLWIFAELMLFVLVGATVVPQNLANAWLPATLLLVCVSLFRMSGVFISLLKTSLKKKERIFCAIAYLPKATVQAAIGPIPLSIGLACGETVLTVAVMAIIITAPIGATLIEKTYKKLLNEIEL